MLDMCQDSDYEMRHAMCSQLPPLVQHLHPEAFKTRERVFDELAELLDDEMSQVHSPCEIRPPLQY